MPLLASHTPCFKYTKSLLIKLSLHKGAFCIALTHTRFALASASVLCFLVGGNVARPIDNSAKLHHVCVAKLH